MIEIYYSTIVIMIEIMIETTTPLENPWPACWLMQRALVGYRPFDSTPGDRHNTAIPSSCLHCKTGDVLEFRRNRRVRVVAG